jgi:hypothetical protein
MSAPPDKAKGKRCGMTESCDDDQIMIFELLNVRARPMFSLLPKTCHSQAKKLFLGIVFWGSRLLVLDSFQQLCLAFLLPIPLIVHSPPPPATPAGQASTGKLDGAPPSLPHT